MEVSGKIIAVLPPQGGMSKAGREWKKQEYVLETHDSFPRKVKFDFFGDRVDQFKLNIGDEVTVSFDIESREFNGRWYTDIRGWKAEKSGAATAAQASQQPQAPIPPINASMLAQGSNDPFANNVGDDGSDLPF